MSEYLSKEEIKQWRSSLEKITLEEFAARLGKKIEEAKPTNDLIDIVLKGQPVVSTAEDWLPSKAERLSSIADRAYEREREISPSPFSISNLKIDVENEQKSKSEKTVKNNTSKNIKPKEVKSSATKSAKKTVKTKQTPATASQNKNISRDEIRIVFKKALTDREQKVFDYFLENNNQIVYAKDLATLLELPRDYVYKYIKNLRAKIEGDKLKNADKGGFILNV